MPGLRQQSRQLARRILRRPERHAVQPVLEGIGARPGRRVEGRCLLSYIVPFIGHVERHVSLHRMDWGSPELPTILETLAAQPPFTRHQMYWESAEIVRQLVARGYVVDVVDDRQGDLVVDPSSYDVVIDEFVNLPSWSERAPDARTVFYATGCEWQFHNNAELQRLQWLYHRRGRRVEPERQVPPLLGPECADLITSFGNEAVNATYGAAGERIRRLAQSCIQMIDAPPPLLGSDDRAHFLYFSGGGWVHKGLDLVVEAFLLEPSLHLTVCTSLDGKSDFEAVYGDDVRRSGNIFMHGTVDPTSQRFRELAGSCSAVISPSAAEAGPGAAMQCMQFGLLPLLTPLVGVVLPQDWPFLAGDSDIALIQSIRSHCHRIAQLPERELSEWRLAVWETTRLHHSHSAYSQSLSEFLDEALAR